MRTAVTIVAVSVALSIAFTIAVEVLKIAFALAVVAAGAFTVLFGVNVVRRVAAGPAPGVSIDGLPATARVV